MYEAANWNTVKAKGKYHTRGWGNCTGQTRSGKTFKFPTRPNGNVIYCANGIKIEAESPPPYTNIHTPRPNGNGIYKDADIVPIVQNKRCNILVFKFPTTRPPNDNVIYCANWIKIEA